MIADAKNWKILDKIVVLSISNIAKEPKSSNILHVNMIICETILVLYLTKKYP